METSPRRGPDLDQAVARIARLRPGELPEPEDFAALCNFEYRPAGLRTVVDNVEAVGNEQMMLEGRIMAGGEQAGTIEHWCHRDGMNQEFLAVKPAAIALEPRAQRRGFGRAMHRALIERCRAAGVHRMEILAQDVGAYAWALEGYDLHSFHPYPEPKAGFGHDPDTMVRLDRATTMRSLARLPRLTSAIDPLPFAARVPASMIEELAARVIGEEANRAMVRPYDSPGALDDHVAAITEGKMTAPRELALFGRDTSWTDDDGHETWLGRELLLLDGTQWRGVMYL